MLWVLFAILAVVAQGQLNSCTYKYYTVNTLRSQDGFSFSCYGVDADCDIYYAPPGSGTSGDSLVSIGTVPENKWTNLIFLGGYQLGGGFFSDNQVGVYYVDKTDGTQVHLPRATEAGTKFHIPVSSETSQQKHECAIFALSSPAEANITINGVVTSLSIDPFGSSNFDIDLSGLNGQAVTMINSDNPIIVSCLGKVTLQSISSEPLLYVARQNEIVSVAISDCSTNELITDFSKVNVTSAIYQTGPACQITSYDSDEIQVLEAKSSDCYFFVEPLDNVCVSMLAISARSRTPNAVGLPESKFSTRFVTHATVSNVGLVSFSETMCTGFPGPSVSLNWLPQPLSEIFSFAAWPASSQFSIVECDDPVLVIVPVGLAFLPYLSGYQPDELWQPFFDPQCPEPPTKAPTDDTPSGNSTDVTPSGNSTDVTPSGNSTDVTPSGNSTDVTPSGDSTDVTPSGNSTSAPSSSDGHSLVSCASWFAFFGFYLFSSSLV